MISMKIIVYDYESNDELDDVNDNDNVIVFEIMIFKNLWQWWCFFSL